MKKQPTSRTRGKTLKKHAGATRPSRPGGLSFADAFTDVFTPPGILPRRRSDDRKNRLPGHVIDAIHIRGYFRRALADLGLHQAGSKRESSK